MVPHPNENPPGSGGIPERLAPEWFRRFRERYDLAADSPTTGLGLFYERHRRFAAYETLSDPNHPEYTDAEWDRVMAGFLSALSGEFGLVQARDPQGLASLAWFLPAEPQVAAVAIRFSNLASDQVVSHDLPEVIRTGAGLAVLMMYPDYPSPPGARTPEEATIAWRDRLEASLRSVPPAREFLLLTISAYSWDVPAPWKGFVWNPYRSELDDAA